MPSRHIDSFIDTCGYSTDFHTMSHTPLASGHRNILTLIYIFN
jgi:hypothetical protein